MRIKYFLPYVFFILLAGCGGDDPGTGLSSTVKSYLNDMVDIMMKNSINRKSIDWSAFRSAVIEKAGTSQTVTEAKAAVEHALALLGDGTTFLVTVNGALINSSEGCTDDAPPEVISDPEIGYIQVPAYSSTGIAAAIFAQNIQGKIQTADQAGVKGWIIDLRGNTGGNMWAMLAGVGPLLGSDPVGYFVDADGAQTAIQYVDGAVKYGDETIISITFPYTVVGGKTSKIAILIDEATASSGEAVAISFAGKANTRSFGATTCGKSAGNQPYLLLDGSVLYLTTAHIADRSEKIYNNEPIMPDELVTDNALIYNAAIDWINE